MYLDKTENQPSWIHYDPVPLQMLLFSVFFQRFGGSAAEHDATRRQGGWLKVVWPWDGCPEAEGKSWSWYQTSCVQSGECKEEQDHIFGKELGGYWGGCTMFFYGAGTGHWFALVLRGGFSTVGDKSFPKEETIL